MSKSPRNDNRMKRARGPSRPSAKNDNRATAPRKRGLHPWAESVDSIDFGPAVAAVADLAGWALDLAAADVADWPEGVRRVRTCRRYVLRTLHGKRTGSIPYEDVLFTAGLLARIFEAELGLGMAEVVAMLDRIGLPTEVVPMMPRIQPHARVPLRAPFVRVAPAPMPRLYTDDDGDDDAIGVAPCDECGHRPRYRNAA